MPMSKRKRDQYSASSGEEGGSQPGGQRHQALVSYVLTAIKEDIKQEIRLVVEETVRKVIKEELKQMNYELAKPIERASSRCIERGDSRNLQLQFKTRLSLPLFTGKQIEGEEGAPICIELINANTENVVESGPEASIKLDVVVLEGDFNKDKSNGWTTEEFENYRVEAREGKAPLLIGDLQVTLQGGKGVLGKLKFTDNSSWNKSKKYRIGLKVASGCCEGVRIREAITDALRVKDLRGESYKKHYPAKPDDDVWRLKMIAKDGPNHNRLTEEGILTVEDLLRQFVRNQKSMRNMLNMSDNKWQELIVHATSCVKSGKLYLYPYDDVMRHGVVFDIIGELKGVIADGSYCLADSLSQEQKEHYNNQVRRAYENWDHVKEFNSADYCMQGQQDYAGLSDCHLTSFPYPAPSELPGGSSGMVLEGYDETAVGGSLLNLQNSNLDVPVQNGPVHLLDQAEVPGHQNLAPTEARLAPPIFPVVSTSSLYGEVFTEKSPPTSLQDDHGIEAWKSNDSDAGSFMSFLFETPDPDFPQYDHETMAQMFDDSDPGFLHGTPAPFLPSRCNSRTAVVSWLRIKAVFRWGFFVRRQVTNRVRVPLTIEQLN
ncbi:calmodulin-binding protein 60 D-like [Punica granatum]|uniref:Uncharacterized protein n=2 Tax=Punica granatum TaxID=22663 RepID=A0A218Y1X9_PUNGR|nr:calmodulin-binding protein 60 D-like [Punica granatum]OWM91307.1 hypothetical protein CDL15_Pgr000251 [Punica granatum]PKI41393.1 hypothetical protein CRG98_038216 [Punica granatum]